MRHQAEHGRLEWVDTAKALAVVLVVVYHCSGWVFGDVFAGATHPVAAAWRELSTVLVPVRIPLFFAMAGVLAERSVHRSWSGLARTRVIDLLWPFILWTLLIAPLWMLRLAQAPPGTGPDFAQSLDLVRGSLFLGGAHYWFLPALVLFLVIAKLAVRAPMPALIGAAAISFVLAPLSEPWLIQHADPLLAANVGRWMLYLFWFLLGCFGRTVVLRVAEHAVWAAVAGTLLFLGAQLATGPMERAWLVPVLSVAGVFGLIGWSALGSRGPPLRRLSHYLATRTLAIYLGHQLLLEMVAVAVGLARRGIPGLDLSFAVAMILFVPLLTCALVWASTAFYDRAVRGRLAWLYRPPAAWKLPIVTSPM